MLTNFSAAKYPRPGASSSAAGKRPTSICGPEVGGVVAPSLQLGVNSNNSSSSGGGGGATTSALSSSSNSSSNCGQSANDVDPEAAGCRIEASQSIKHQHNHSVVGVSSGNNIQMNRSGSQSSVQSTTAAAAGVSASGASSSTASSTAATTPSEGSTSRSASAPQIR